MKKVRAFLYVLKNSLTNSQYYSALKDTPFWFSLKYLYTLLVITTLISLLPVIITLGTLVPQLENTLKTAYPKELVLTLQNGQLSTNVPQPYVYKDFIVIDTTAKVEDYSKYKDKIFITKDAIVSPDNKITYLNEIKDNLTVDYDSYQRAIKQMEPYFKPAFWVGLIGLIILGPILGAGFILIWNLITLLIISFLVYLFVKTKFTFRHTYQMAMHASTLPIIFFVVLGLFGLSPAVPFGYPLILLLFMGIVLNRIWTTNS